MDKGQYLIVKKSTVIVSVASFLMRLTEVEYEKSSVVLCRKKPRDLFVCALISLTHSTLTSKPRSRDVFFCAPGSIYNAGHRVLKMKQT